MQCAVTLGLVRLEFFVSSTLFLKKYRRVSGRMFLTCGERNACGHKWQQCSGDSGDVMVT